jgi:hypothetical protein
MAVAKIKSNARKNPPMGERGKSGSTVSPMIGAVEVFPIEDAA